eukprot:g17272.t1
MSWRNTSATAGLSSQWVGVPANGGDVLEQTLLFVFPNEVYQYSTPPLADLGQQGRGVGTPNPAEVELRSGAAAATIQMPNRQVARSHLQLPYNMLLKSAKLASQDIVSIGELETVCGGRAGLSLWIKINTGYPEAQALGNPPRNGRTLLQSILHYTGRVTSSCQVTIDDV